jgi:hypothetical protein
MGMQILLFFACYYISTELLSFPIVSNSIPVQTQHILIAKTLPGVLANYIEVVGNYISTNLWSENQWRNSEVYTRNSPSVFLNKQLN